MSVKIKEIEENIILIELGKDFIEFMVNEFKKKIKELNINDSTNIIVDFKKIKFISSSGIASVGALYNIMKNNRGKLIFIGVNSNVKTLFNMIKLTKEIIICKNLKEALANVQ